MLRGQRDGPDSGRREPHRCDRQQLRFDELQFRADAPVVARVGAAGRLRRDSRGGPSQRGEVLGARLGAGAALQPHDPAARQRARQGDPGGLGHSRLRAAVRPARRRACGCPRPPSTSRLSKLSPPTASGSRSSLRTRPTPSARSARRRGPSWRERRSIPRGPTGWRFPRAPPSRPSSTTDPFRGPWPSTRRCSRRGRPSPNGSWARFPRNAGGPSSSTRHPTGRPTATITATAKWPWPMRPTRSKPGSARA